MESGIYLDAEFSSYEEFRNVLNKYETANCTKFITVNTRLIPVTDSLHATFRYYAIRLQCKRGIKKHASQATGIRQKGSLKVGCPVMINLRLDKSKMETPLLKVTKLFLEHEGHGTTPEMRRLEMMKKRRTRIKDRQNDSEWGSPLCIRSLVGGSAVNDDGTFHPSQISNSVSVMDMLEEEVAFEVEVRDEKVLEALHYAMTDNMSGHSPRSSCCLMQSTHFSGQGEKPQSASITIEPGHSHPVSSTLDMKPLMKHGSAHGTSTDKLYANYLKVSTELKARMSRKMASDDQTEMSMKELKKKKLLLAVEVKELEKEKLQLEIRNMIDIAELEKQKLQKEIQILKRKCSIK